MTEKPEFERACACIQDLRAVWHDTGALTMKPLDSSGRARRPLLAALALALAATALSGCTTTPPDSPQARSSSATSADARIDANVASTLQRLYQVAPGSREMVRNAHGVLVFPKVYGGALIVGAEHGQGALVENGHVVGYYATTGASIGWQAGASSKAEIYVFNTAAALQKFKASNGWQVGADATVAIGHVGANGSLDTTTASEPVVGFVMNNAGVEAGASLNGTKITRVPA
jgi:lipid-binding SYLF domain-containing protein